MARGRAARKQHKEETIVLDIAQIYNFPSELPLCLTL